MMSCSLVGEELVHLKLELVQLLLELGANSAHVLLGGCELLDKAAGQLDNASKVVTLLGDLVTTRRDDLGVVGDTGAVPSKNLRYVSACLVKIWDN